MNEESKKHPTIVDFHGRPLLSQKSDDGTVMVAMLPIIEGMGMDWKSQHRKIVRQASKFNHGHMTMVASDGKQRSMLCIPLTKLNGWLFSINPNKIPNPEIRAKVIQYQEECFVVLHDYWHKGCATNPRGTLPEPEPSRRLPRHDVALWNMRPWAYAKELYPELYEELEKRYKDLGADKHRGWESLKDSIFYETEELGVILEYLVAKAPMYLESILKLQLAALGHGLVFDELDKLYRVDRAKLTQARKMTEEGK